MISSLCPRRGEPVPPARCCIVRRRSPHEEGADVVRWITAGDNERARRVYDAHAIATPWVTYDMKPADG